MFTAGLLHDLGKEVMHEAFPNECVAVWKAPPSDAPSDEVERSQFGTDHTEVGAELLRRWQFPEMYQHAAQWHSCPDNCLPQPRGTRDWSRSSL